jgi:hypothetical protein
VVDRIIHTGSSTFGARLELLNAEHQIPSGQRCELTFLWEENPSAGQLASRLPIPGS